MDAGQALERAHAAHAARRFRDACEAFDVAAEAAPLSSDDLLTYGDAAWWVGWADRSLELAERAHLLLLEEGRRGRAGKEAVVLGLLLLLRGDFAAGSGWIQRGRSLLEQAPGCPERGYLVHVDAERALAAGELDVAVSLAVEARTIGRDAGDVTLAAAALMTEGTARLRAGRVAEGSALVDEAMLSVTAGLVTPEFAGALYCQMISLCWSLGDLRRARAWTEATERWCAGFDRAVMFSGICRMHRVQLAQIAGEWDRATASARQVCSELHEMNVAVTAEGHYLLGDLLRLRGDTVAAERAYLRAHALGRDPQPGLALLRLASGHAAAAVASLRTSLAASGASGYERAPLLRGLVDAALATSRSDLARQAADELITLAATWTTDGLAAAAAAACGDVELAAGEPRRAVIHLREAITRWQAIGAPYEVARCRVRLAATCRELGDHDLAALELESAERAFIHLGAVVDLDRLSRQRRGSAPPGGLTRREAEVLSHVAEGGTNREVAAALVISERTVARHLANLYPKLGVTTRTAAAAWARQHGLQPLRHPVQTTRPDLHDPAEGSRRSPT